MRLVQITLYFLRLGNKTKPEEPDGVEAHEKNQLRCLADSHRKSPMNWCGWGFIYHCLSALRFSPCAPVFQSGWQIFRLLHSLLVFSSASRIRVSVRLNGAASSILLRFSRPLWIIYILALNDMLADHHENNRMKKKPVLMCKKYSDWPVVYLNWRPRTAVWDCDWWLRNFWPRSF
jgi:hypothetical protein